MKEEVKRGLREERKQLISKIKIEKSKADEVQQTLYAIREVIEELVAKGIKIDLLLKEDSDRDRQVRTDDHNIKKFWKGIE